MTFFFFLLFIFIFWPRREACEILVPQPGTEPVPPAVEEWSLNHWTAKEVPLSLSEILAIVFENLL